MYKKIFCIAFLSALSSNVYAGKKPALKDNKKVSITQKRLQELEEKEKKLKLLKKEDLKYSKISKNKKSMAMILRLDPKLVKGDENLVKMVEKNTYLQHIEKLPDLENFFPKFPDLAKKTVLLDMASHIAKETVQADNQKKDALVFFLEKFLTNFSNKMTEKGVWRNTILDTLAPYAEDPKVLGILKAVYNDVSKDLSEKEKEDLLNHLTGKFNNTEIACLFKTVSSSKSEKKIPPQKKSKKMNRDLR